MRRVSNFLIYLFFLCVLCGKTLAEPPPAADEIRRIISNANEDLFEKDTFPWRMQLELSGKLLKDPNKDFFFQEHVFADREHLDFVEDRLQQLANQIEHYEGTDWEQLYGATGLWRQVAAAIERTKFNKIEMDYYLAILIEDSQKKQKLEEILARLNRPGNKNLSASQDLLTAKVLCALSGLDESYKKTAAEQFSKLKLRQDLPQCDSLNISLEQIKCFGPSEPNELSVLSKSLAQSECRDGLEMLLPLAILQRKYSPDELQNTLSLSAETAGWLGRLLLGDLSIRFGQIPAIEANIESINPADAELVAPAILNSTNPQPYCDFMMKLADNNKFQSPAVLYAAGALSQQTQPKKTAVFLIKASDLQSKHQNALLNLTAEEIARRAFEIAYQEFTKDPNECQPAINAYENYSRVAPEKIDEQTQYLYADLLKNCARQNEAAEAFRALAKRSQSLWGDAATLELLKIELKKATDLAYLTEINDVLNRLHDFILRCTRPEERETQLRFEAMNLYCETLLNQGSPASAAKVLQILDAALPAPGLRYELFRALAFEQLGRLEESSFSMSKAILSDGNSLELAAAYIASQIIDKIELLQQNTVDFNTLLENCDNLAAFAYKNNDNRQNALFLAEVSVLRSDLNRAENLLKPLTDENDINWLRPKARLLMAKNDCTQAAQIWSKIAELQRNDLQEQNRKSYGWWQAKFYELNCLSKLPPTKPEDLRHTIEVLQSTYPEIPAPWAEKLNKLNEFPGRSI